MYSLLWSLSLGLGKQRNLPTCDRRARYDCDVNGRAIKLPKNGWQFSQRHRRQAGLQMDRVQRHTWSGGVAGCWEPAQNGAPSQARAAAPAAPFSPQSSSSTPLAWTCGPGVAQPLPCGTHGAGGGRGAGGSACRSVPAPCPACGSGSGTHACAQGAAARRPAPLPARAVARCVTRPAVLPSRTEVPD